MSSGVGADSDEEGRYSRASRRGICYAFEKGECERGDLCRFAHLPPSGGSGDRGGRGSGHVVGVRSSSSRNSGYSNSTVQNVVHHRSNLAHINSVNQIAAADDKQRSSVSVGVAADELLNLSKQPFDISNKEKTITPGELCFRCIYVVIDLNYLFSSCRRRRIKSIEVHSQ